MFSHAIRHLSDTVSLGTEGLPYDAEVEYIESTGTQYIDTGIIMPDTYSFGVTFEALNSKGATWILFFGWRNGSYQYQFNYRTDNQNPGFAWDINSNAGRNGGTGYSNTWYTIECNSSGTSRQLVVNDSVLQTWTGASQNTNALKAYLFASNVSGNAEQRGQMARVSRAWIKDENGNIVRDLVAVRVGTEYCLYDKANPTGGDNGDGLYHNKGTGAFKGSVDKPKSGTKFLVSKAMGNSLGKIKPVLKHYDMAVRYRIDECNGNLQTAESVNFPSGKYTALDYTPTYEHHRFVGWQNSSQDGEAEFLDSLPTGYTYSDGGNVMLTGVHPGPNTSFEIKARALNQTMSDVYGISGVAAANAECRWGCDETIDGVRTRYFININMGGWSTAYAFYNVNNGNGNSANFKYKSADIGIFGYDASSKTVYTKTDANVVVNSTVLPDETTIKQFTGDFKFFGCPADSSAVSTTAALTCRPARLYYAKFWESGVLIRDYVPYVKNGVACLLDKVSGTFLYNYGTGIMMSGPLKATPVEYIAPSDNIIYHAKLISAVWQSPTTVTFDATTNGGQMPSGWTAPDYYEGQPYGTLPTPTHATLNFTGWYINGSKVIATDLVQANATLVAQYAASSYSVDISNGDWELEDPNTNPDTSAYDGVYRNSRYWNSPPGEYADKLYINVVGYTSFTVYIRSNAEVNYSYTIAVKADYDPTSFNDAISNKQGATTANNTSTAISGYTAVTYTLDGGSHTLCIVYGHKDTIKQNDDRGYLLIPKQQ